MVEKRVALVTGASRGIGRAIAIALGADGLFVVVNYTANEAAAVETLQKIKDAGGAGALSRFDVADAAAVDAAVKQIATEQGRLDVLVNNAGIAIDGLLLRTKKEDWQRTIDVNLSGAFHCCKARRAICSSRSTGASSTSRRSSASRATPGRSLRRGQGGAHRHHTLARQGAGVARDHGQLRRRRASSRPT